jgi:hypothetical protein
VCIVGPNLELFSALEGMTGSLPPHTHRKLVLPPHFPFIEEDDLSLKSFSGKHAQFSRRFRMRDARQNAWFFWQQTITFLCCFKYLKKVLSFDP